MIVNSLINQNFLQPPEDYAILAEFPSNSKKLISLEVVETLTQRLLDSINNVTDNKLSSNSSVNVKSPLKFTALPDTFSSNHSFNSLIWKLPTWQHIKWISHAISPIFSLNLDSINSISNAVKIYCLWIQNPLSRPLGINSNPEKLEEFITFILLDLSELFETRKEFDVKTSTSQQQQLSKRHIELCRLVLKTIHKDLISNSPSLFAEKSSPSWKFLIKLLLGVSDGLLWNEKSNYLADNLTEDLLNILFTLFLQSEICDEELLWKRFADSFKIWCHRLKVVLSWGSVLIALTAHISKILYFPPSEDYSKISFGLHSTQYQVTIKNHFSIYTWIRITNFLPKLSDLTGDIFLHTMQSFEKLISIWLSVIDPNDPARQTEKIVPNANTIFEIYGEFIFEGIGIEKTSHEQGRAIAISILCQIISKWQYREDIKINYIATSFDLLKNSLQSENIHTASASLLSIESVLVSNLPGLRCLLFPVFLSILQFIPKPKQNSKQLPVNEKLRLCCYKLLSIIYPYFSVENKPSIISSELESFLNFKSLETNSIYSTLIFGIFSSNPGNRNISLVLLNAHVLDILVGSLLQENILFNTRYLLNLISTLLNSQYTNFPELFALLVKIFEEYLCKPSTSTITISLDNQMTIVNILEQWSRIGNLEIEDSSRLCFSLINFLISLHSKSNLAIYYRLMISIFNCIFSWLSVSNSPVNCVSAFISALVQFINDPQSLQSKKTLNSSSPLPLNKTTQSRATPVSPSFYGAKTRKTLSERVFTPEIEDSRPESISPNFKKNVEEIFLEYSDLTLQRVMNLLLQDQINLNYPVKMDSIGIETELELELKLNSKIRYFSLSSSIIIGFIDDLIIVRNSFGKFIWRHDYKESQENDFENRNEPNMNKSKSSIPLDEEPPVALVPFKIALVVTGVDEERKSNEVILNESNWTKPFTSKSLIAKKIKSIEKEIENHLKNEIYPELPLKSRLNKVCPQTPKPKTDTDHLRQILTHFGFLNPGTHGLLCPLGIDFCTTKALESELEKLDELSCRETIQIPVYFVPSNYEQHEENTLRTEGLVSKSFESFIKGLGTFNESFSGPIYADSSVEVNFPVILLSPLRQDQGPESAVSIIWSEDSENLSNIFSNRLPVSSFNFCHLLICPHYILGAKGQYFRIKIVMMSCDYNLNFGPLLDGMVVNGTNLSKMIRETSILASQLVLSQLQNSSNPIMKRQNLLKTMVFKNHKTNSYGSLLNQIL